MTTAQTANPDALNPAAADTAAAELRSAEIRQALPQWVTQASGLASAPARNPSLPTLVGLLMLILSFFVVLTGISLKDQKREASVMSSLEQTFSGTGGAPPTTQATSEQDMRRVLGDLRASVTAEVPLVTGVPPAAGDNLVLRLPRNLVFDAPGTGLANGFPSILEQTKTALNAAPGGYVYEVEVAIQAPRMDEAAIGSGALVDAALRAAGFAAGSAVVSLAEGAPNNVTLIVRLRPNARLNNSGDVP